MIKAQDCAYEEPVPLCSNEISDYVIDKLLERRAQPKDVV